MPTTRLHEGADAAAVAPRSQCIQRGGTLEVAGLQGEVIEVQSPASPLRQRRRKSVTATRVDSSIY